jgi:hypothetical protein
LIVLQIGTTHRRAAIGAIHEFAVHVVGRFERLFAAGTFFNDECCRDSGGTMAVGAVNRRSRCGFVRNEMPSATALEKEIFHISITGTDWITGDPSCVAVTT